MVRESFLEEIGYELHIEYFSAQRLMMKGGEAHSRRERERSNLANADHAENCK